MSGRRSPAHLPNAIPNTSKDLLHDLDDPLISQLHEYTNPATQPIAIPQPKNFGTLARRPSLSTSSQTSFGSFISAADHHPLQSPAHDELLPFSSSKHTNVTSQRTSSHHHDVHSPSKSNGLLGRFGEDANLRSRENENRLLKEIVEHEDDPLYWVDIDRGSQELSPVVTSDSDGVEKSGNTKAESSVSSSRPSSPDPLTVQNMLEEAMLIDLERVSSGSTMSSLASTASVSSSSPRSSSARVDHSRSSTPHPTSTTQIHPEATSSLSHSPSRSTSPSFTAPSTSVGSLPGSWVSSILGSASRFRQQHLSQHPSIPSVPTSTSTSNSSSSQVSNQHTHPEPQSQHTLPSILPSQIKQIAPQSLLHMFDSASSAEALPSNQPNSHAQQIPKHAKTISFGSTLSTRQPTFKLKHGTPFGSHPFTGADGAPGFAGLNRNWNEHGFEYGDAERDSLKGVQLVGRNDVTLPVLTGELADSLRPHLPVLTRLSTSWSLLYSLDQHGISIKTLYTRCALHTGTALIVIKDTAGNVFGACVNEGIHLSKRSSYYGSGDSFLWSQISSQNLQVYKWTGKNEYVALCEPTFLSFGGGDGHYGLYLEDSLLNGTTNPCPTYGNEYLAHGTRAGRSVRFECVGLEVWGVDQ